jgi:hypothetical protein
MRMAAGPLRLYAPDIGRAPIPYRYSGLVILALSLASWTATLAGAALLIRVLF